MPKTRRKSEENRLFQKTRIQTILDKSPWDSTAIFIFFLLFLGSLLKQCSVFEILLQFTLPPTLYKVKTRKKILDTRVQHVIFCTRTLHWCNRYPFRLLVKSVSARCIRARYHGCKALTVFFFLWFWFLFVLILFVCLFVCCCFCFLFLLKNSLLLIVYLSFRFLILFYVSFFGEKNRTDKDKLPIAVRKEKHNTWTHGLLWSISMPAKVPGGCRLQFEQIARDVQCRKPSSKDDIMWSTWFCCYSNCDNCFNSFRKENCCYRSKASPLSF